jgi:Domain of unknown function (DUF222)/HNH endonuclease
MSTAAALRTESRTELERLGDEIAKLSAQVDVAIARLLALIREFDDRQGWRSGFRSCAEWLAWRVGLDLGAARERVRVARALAKLPSLAGALGRGEISYAKTRALTRVATPHTEARLLAISRTTTAAQVERLVRGWRAEDPAADRREAGRRHESRALHVHHDETGMVVIHGRLDPEAGALFMRALEAAQDALYRRPKPVKAPTPPQQRADALALVAESALHHELDPGAPGERYQVVLHADQTPQATLEDGTRVSAETSERLSCDASRTVMRHDAEGRVIEVSARTRTVPPALRRALLHRDQVCRFPGCGLRFVQAHHIRHWAHGGPTTLSNLVLLCRYHHRAVHEEGFQVTHLNDGSLGFLRPDGQRFLEAPAQA